MPQALTDLARLSTIPELRAVLDQPDRGARTDVSLRDGSVEMNYFVARAELARGNDLRHGVTHLADVLAADPARAETLALVDAYASAAGGIEALLPGQNEGNLYFATEALRALAWGKSGRLASAVDLLLQVSRAKPDVRFIDAWVLPQVEGGTEALAPDLTMQLLATVLSAFTEHSGMPAARVKVAARWARVALTFARRATLAEALKPTMDMLVAGICRKAGLFDEGLAYTDEAIRARPSWHSHIARGLLLRRKGAVDEARASFENAIRTDPAKESSYLEAGDMYFDVERWTEARGYYELALAKSPGHPWATPSVHFCRWRERHPDAAFPNDDYPQELFELMRSGNHRAHYIYDAFRHFVGFVPEPRDATTNVIRQFVERSPTSPATELKVTLSDIEGPSNGVLMRFLYGDSLRLSVSYKNVATPDPRNAHEPVAFTLWRRDGEALVPALPPPAPEIAAIIRELASARFEVNRAWAAASWAADRLESASVESLLGCITHPPRTRDGSGLRAGFAWIPRVQLTVAFVLAHLRVHEPWESSVRRAALLSLLHGPMDWSTESAIIALTHVANAEPFARTDIHRAFARLLAARPSSGAVSWEETLYHVWPDVPGLFPNELEELRERIRAMPK